MRWKSSHDASFSGQNFEGEVAGKKQRPRRRNRTQRTWGQISQLEEGNRVRPRAPGSPAEVPRPPPILLSQVGGGLLSRGLLKINTLFEVY